MNIQRDIERFATLLYGPGEDADWPTALEDFADTTTGRSMVAIAANGQTPTDLMLRACRLVITAADGSESPCDCGGEGIEGDDLCPVCRMVEAAGALIERAADAVPAA